MKKSFLTVAFGKGFYNRREQIFRQTHDIPLPNSPSFYKNVRSVFFAVQKQKLEISGRVGAREKIFLSPSLMSSAIISGAESIYLFSGFAGIPLIPVNFAAPG